MAALPVASSSGPLGAGGSPWTLRRCLVWCLPALIVATVLRISLLAAIPEAYYGSDSNSYFSATLKLYTKGKLAIEGKRRWLYPIFLMATPPLPGSVPQTVAVVQHLVGLATLVGIGWVAGNVGNFRGPVALGSTLLAALCPRMLWYEHEIVAESWMLAVFVLAIALACPLDRLRKGRGLFWFFVAAGLIAAFKPHGRPLWLALVTLGSLWHFRQIRWTHLAVLAGTVGLVLTSGNDRQGSWLLLSSTLPLVQTQGEKWAEYRAALAPVVERVRDEIRTYPYIQNRYKKPLKRDRPTPEFGPVWAGLNQRETEFAVVAKGLALEGIRTQPWRFAELVTRRIAYVLADATSADDLPVAHFWDQQERRNVEHREENPRELPFLYEASEGEIAQMVAERRQRKLWFEPYLTQASAIWTWATLEKVPGQPIPEPGFKWTGILALLGIASLAVRRQWKYVALLTLPTAFYLLVVFSVGDRIARYLHPVDWIGILLLILAWDGAATLLFYLFRRRNAPASRVENRPAAAP